MPHSDSPQRGREKEEGANKDIRDRRTDVCCSKEGKKKTIKTPLMTAAVYDLTCCPSVLCLRTSSRTTRKPITVFSKTQPPQRKKHKKGLLPPTPLVGMGFNAHQQGTKLLADGEDSALPLA